MSRIISAILLIILTLAFVACGGDSQQSDSNKTDVKNDISTDVQNNVTIPPTVDLSDDKVTLMVYMVGSDLEAKSAAGTNDMEEMLAAGVDLSKADVLVLAGGAKRWHNDYITGEGLTLLRMTKDGFEAVKTFPQSSMGESAGLSDFLTYCYSNYPAEKFALIMWDHGNGPIIGYGKDMLFDNDSLTLSEMQTAFAASPFSKDNKLSWIGFDACLMASAELNCVLADYAEYLISSQEVEPAFGWNYSFLANINAEDPKALFKSITDTYLNACNEYFESRGYDDRDVTLSCVDLSCAERLNEAVDALFTAAAKDVANNFNKLSANRAETRALGRASTGSEYDLIDIGDMAKQLSELYPTESAALTAVLEEMIIVNATNAQGCCGMSIYYPFYNKDHYQKDWWTVYEELNVFDSYVDYLKKFSQKWLGNDLLETVAQSTTPTAVSDSEFYLELTAAQAEAYASGRFIVMEKEGDDLYQPVFISSNIQKQDNKLVAVFDGNVIYGKTDYNEYFIPFSAERDTVGDISRYGVPVSVTDRSASSFVSESGNQYYQYQIAANNAKKHINISALVPYDDEVTSDQLTGGKLEDADLSGMTTLFFMEMSHYYITRYDNGVIKPLKQWIKSDYYSGFDIRIDMGLSFVFAPVPAGEYYLTFEIEDTQGNRYCSDFLPIESDGGVIEEPIKPDPISVDWETGDKVTLAEKDGVSLFFTTVEDSAGVKAYTVGAVNKTDKEIYVNCKDLYINGNVYVTDFLGVFTVAPGQTATYEYGIDLGACAELGISDDLQSLSFTATVETNAERKLIFYEQGISVNFSDETRIIYQPDYFSFKFAPTAAVFRSFMAEKQVVYEDADVKVWLLSLGGQKDFTDEYSPNLYGALCYENLSDKIINICVTGLVFDDTYVPLSSSVISIPGNCKYYSTICVLEEELNQAGISSASKIQLLIKRTAFNTLAGGGGFAQLDWCDVKLSAFGAATALQHGDTVIYDSNGIKISLLSIEGDRWNLCIENNRDEAVYVGITDTMVDGKEVYDGTEDYFGFADSSLGANQKCFAYAYYGNWNDWNATCNKAEFKIKVLDFAEEKVLFTDNTVITLTKDMK